jgi:hypothetical protein
VGWSGHGLDNVVPVGYVAIVVDSNIAVGSSIAIDPSIAIDNLAVLEVSN